MLDNILQGIYLTLTFKTFGIMTLGILLGIFVGAVPGLTIMMTLAILLPIGFYLPPLIGIPFFLGLFKGGLFGGSIPAILINIPGTAAAIPTCYDGYPLAKKGQARKALHTALLASVIGDTSSDVVTLLFIGPVALIALMLGPPELAAIVLLAFVAISSVGRGALVKGLIMVLVGLFFSMIGQDPLGFMSRFTFGIFAIKAGIPLVPMLIGVYVIPEILMTVEKESVGYISEKLDLSKLGERLRFHEFRRCIRTIMRSTAIGTALGACPAIGAVVAAFVGYAAAKKASKHPETFGKGELEGVAAPEAANNATNGPTLIPMLTMGIPGDETTALLMGAFMAQGLRPGPQLMQEQGPLVYGILMAMFMGNILFLVLGYLTLPLFIRVSQVKKALLLPMISVIAFAGSYVFRSDPFDLLVMVFFGIIGYIARKLHFDFAPMVIGFILGPILEMTVGQTLNMVEGGLLHWLFVNRPIAGAILMIIPLWVLWTLVRAIRRRKAKANNFSIPMKGGGE